MRKIPFGKPVIGEEEKSAVIDVLSSGMLVHGSMTDEFEKAFAAWSGAEHCVSVASCTAGMHLFYFANNIGAGDEVIVPAMTHVATAHAVELTGARAVFVDAESETGNIDISQIESAITDRTRAISIVHYLGYPVDMSAINSLASKHNLLVLEDCALAVGTRYKGVHAGLHGDAGAFSFYPVKHMTTAEGGVVLTRHEQLALQLKRKKAFGVDRTVGERTTPGEYDVTMLGFNYRMNEIEAAIGIEQVKKLDDILLRRKQNHEYLQQHLAECDELHLFKENTEDYQGSYYCFVIVLKEQIANKRLDLIKHLNDQGVGTSIYYPRAVPLMQYYRDKYGASEDDFPIATGIGKNSIALPVGPHLGEEDMNYIVNQVKEGLNKVK